MKAYFAGGCFWCMTPIFRLCGAEKVVAGYSGGDEEDPAYEDVKAQRTSHRETVMVEYDPGKTPYEKLLDVYFANVDPFDPDGQFIDRGRSYSLAIYYVSDEEKRLAEARVGELEAASGRPVCVAIEPFGAFYEAEEYHQDYDLKHPAEFEKELTESGRRKP